MTTSPGSRLLAPGRLTRSFLIAWVIVMGVTAALTFGVAAPRLRARALAELATSMQQTADLRMVSVQDWRRDALADARTVAGFPTSGVLVQAHPTDAPDPHFTTILANFADLHDVRSISVLDARAAMRASSPDTPALSPEALALVRAALGSRRDSIEFERDASGRPTIVVCALVNGGDGVVVAQYDPARWLYPLLDSPLSVTRWGTALLLRREPGAVRALSGGGPRPGHAVRRPFARVRGALFPPGTGLVQGVDEWGEPALAVVRELQGSGWALGIEVDEAGALGPVESGLGVTGLAAAALLTALLALGYSLVWGQRRASESAIARSHARFSAVLEHAGDPILLLDDALRVIVASPRAERFYGRAVGELTGRRALETLRAPGAGPDLHAVVHDARRDGGGLFETEHVAAHGERVPVEIRLNRADGEARSAWVAVVRDLRARRDTEQRILRLNRLLQATASIATEVQHAADPGVLLGRACRIAVDVGGFRLAAVALANPDGPPALAALAAADEVELGPLPPDAVVHRAVDPSLHRSLATHARVVVPDLAAEGAAEAHRDLAQRLGLRGCAASPILVDGVPRGALALVAPEPNAFDDEAIALIDGMAADLGSALRGAEERLARQRLEQRMAALFTIGPAGFAVTAPDGRLTSASDAFLRLVGAPREALDAGELRWPDLFNEPDASPAPFGTPYETSARRRDGTRVPVLVGRVRPEPGLDEAIAVVLDMSRLHETADSLRQTQERLVRSQKLETVGRLAGGVAHDFNNLLTIIQGHAELLRGSQRGDDAGALEQILRASERAAALTRQLLAFSRQQVMEARVIDPGALVGDMEKMLRRVLAERIELAVHVAPGCGNVRVDPGQLEQVLLNLVVNARDALPEGGRIVIAVGERDVDEAEAEARAPLRPGPHVRLAVSDDGIGITPEVMSRLFEPFFTTKEPGKGTGLGLATAYGIVTQSGGHIGVTSAPGTGACFEVLLPRVDEALTRVDAASPVPRGTGEGVLLVEDEPAVLDLTQRMLTSEGYRVVAASGADEALRLAAELRDITVLVSDVVLRGLDGRSLAERLRATRPRLAVLLMSGYSETPGRGPSTLPPDVAFLAKPFTTAQLLTALRSAIARRPTGRPVA